MIKWETCWKAWTYINKDKWGNPFSEMEEIDKLTNEMGEKGWEAWSRHGQVIYFKRKSNSDF